MAGKSKADHVVLDMQSGDLLCKNCGGTYKITLPAPIDMWVAQGEVFTKRHKNCAKTWTPPPPVVIDPGTGDKQSRINKWLASGERGISSNTMLEVITGISATSGAFGRCEPCDPDDFKRCWKLLNAVPELREEFPILANESDVWKALVDNWDELAAMMPKVLEEWKGERPYPTASRMYDRMKELGC